MPRDNIFTIILNFIFKDLVLDILNFPVWWYGKGLKERWRFLVKNIKEANRRTALVLWLKNLFTPMYGYYDIWSRLISFFMRLVLLPFKFIFFYLWSAFYFSIFLFYFFLPFLAAFMILRSY